MTTRNLLALVVLASGCMAPSDVGGSRVPIVDGRIAADADVGATVALMIDGFPECTGTLVTPHVVVTAAHCLLNQDDRGNFGAPLSPSELSVVVGAVDPISASAEQTHAVAVVWANETFPGDEAQRTGLTDEHDIGVLVLADDVLDVVPAPVLEPALLDEELTPRRMLLAAGYGTTDRAGLDDNTLLHVAEVPFIERSDRELIAGDPNAVDTCYGDSGGPLYVESESGLWLVGVTSRGVDSYREDCDSGTVATLAPAYLDHILEAIGEDVTEAYVPVGEAPMSPGPDPSADSASASTESPAPSSSVGASGTVTGCAAGGRFGSPPPALAYLGLLFLVGFRAVARQRRTRGS